MTDYFETIGDSYPAYAGLMIHGVYDSLAHKTFIAFQGLDTAFNPNPRGAYVKAFNHTPAINAWEPTVRVCDTLINDDHGNPSICQDAAGYLHVFSGAHASGPHKHFVSDNPRDITAWTEATSVGDVETYPSCVVALNKLWLFSRNDSLYPDFDPVRRARFVYFLSDGVGVSTVWSSANPVVDFGDDTRTYHTEVEVIGGDQIHFMIHRAEGGDANRRDPYYGILDANTGDLSNIDGSVTIAAANLPADLHTMAKSFRIVSQPSYKGGGVTISRCRDFNGFQHILFCDAPTTGFATADDPHNVYHMAYIPGQALGVTSYDNLGGMGDRTKQIRVTSTLPLNVAPDRLVNGVFSNALGFTDNTTTSGYFCFDFGPKLPKVINGLKWYQDIAADQGTWKIAGSNEPSGAVGNRWGQIAIDTDLTLTEGISGAYCLLDGQLTDGNNLFTTGQSSRHLTFDFGAGESKVINGFKWYQAAAQSQGTWSFQGSNNGTDWTNLQTGIDLGGSGATQETTFSNTTGYRYYRLNQTAGTTSDAQYVYQIEFKISEVGGTPSYDPGQDYTDVATGLSFGAGAAMTEVTFTNTIGYRYYKLEITGGHINWDPWLHEIEFKIVDFPGDWTAPLLVGTIPNRDSNWTLAPAKDGGVDIYGTHGLFVPSGDYTGGLYQILRHRNPGANGSLGPMVTIQTATDWALDNGGHFTNGHPNLQLIWFEVSSDTTDANPLCGNGKIWAYGALGYVGTEGLPKEYNPAILFAGA